MNSTNTLPEQKIKDFIKLAKGNLSYVQPEIKDKFHRLGREVAKEIASLLGLSPGSYEIRSNKGGIAVSGEITLHAEHLYIQFFRGERFLWRICRHNRDFSGLTNQWMSFDDLSNLETCCQTWKLAMERYQNSLLYPKFEYI